MLPFLAAAAPVAGLLGRIFGGASQGSAQQRMGENQQALLQAQMTNRDSLERAGLQSNNANTRAQLQNSGDQFRAGLDMERKRFQQNEPSVQAGQALRGSLMQNIQPIRAPRGFTQNPSIIDAIGPEARQAGGLLAQRGLQGLQNPTQFEDMPAVSLPEVLNLPPQVLAQMQKSGLLEKIMGGLGIGGSLLGALGTLDGGAAERTDGTV